MSKLSKAIDGIIDKPFQLYGRGPYAFDCLGCIVYLYRECFNVELPDPFGDYKVSDIVGEFFELPNLACIGSGDVLWNGQQPRYSKQHVALVENKEWAVESQYPSGVVRRRVSEFGPGWSARRYKGLLS